MPTLLFINSPKVLPRPPAEGRAVLLDLAFAAGDHFEKVTRPFIDALSGRLARWIDHHPHPAWGRFRHDDRFLLVDKSQAPACPQLVTEELVQEIGPVDHLLAHADFDGFLSAVKFLRGGVSPYPEADEDGRAIDAPGRGYVCSARGLRLARAIEESRDLSPSAHAQLLEKLAWALRDGEEPPALTTRIDELVVRAMRARARLLPLLATAKELSPGILGIASPTSLSTADKKFLLRELESRAPLAFIEEPAAVTVATFDEAIRLTSVRGLHGTDGYAWGQARIEALREGLERVLQAARRT